MFRVRFRTIVSWAMNNHDVMDKGRFSECFKKGKTWRIRENSLLCRDWLISLSLNGVSNNHARLHITVAKVIIACRPFSNALFFSCSSYNTLKKENTEVSLCKTLNLLIFSWLTLTNVTVYHTIYIQI